MPQHDIPPAARRPAPDVRVDPLADPGYAPHVWGRFKRILAWMALFSAGIGAGSVAILWHLGGPLPIHMIIATFLGVGLSILMAAALMGLIFLSSGSGHDEAVGTFEPDDDHSPRFGADR